MTFPRNLKSNVIAAIGTVIIHLLLFLALSLEFNDESSSRLSELDDLVLQMENMAPEEVQMTPPGKDPLAAQKDKSSESISKEKGGVKAQHAAPPAERTPEEQEAQAQTIPETLAVPKPEVVQLQKKDSIKEATEKDSVLDAQISKIQKVLNTSADANSKAYQKEREKYQYYVKNYKNIRNFKKVYPYALKTREIIENLNRQLKTMTNESEKKQLIKETEKMLFKEYETAVRTMTTSQGRLLLKLIARETNKTGYEIIKDYKGSLPASFWYGVGKIFGTDLKSEFHKEKEDSLIENILKKYKDNDLY